MDAVVEKPSKWGKVLKVFIILAVLLLVVFAGFYFWTGIPAGAASYSTNKKAAEDAGIFFSMAELDKLNGLPRSDNAAELIAQTIPPKLEGIGVTYDEDIRKKWPEIQTQLDKLELAAQRKVVIGPLDYVNGVQLDSNVRQKARIWTTDLLKLASTSAEKGDLAATRRYFRLAAFLINSQDDDHTYLGLRRRVSATSQCCLNLRNLVPKYGQKKEWRDMMTGILKSFDKPYDLPNAIRAENVRLQLRLDWINSQNAWSHEYGMDDQIAKEFAYGPKLPRFREANLSTVYEYLTKLLKEVPADSSDFDGIEHAYTLSQPILDKEKWDSIFLQYELTADVLEVRLMRLSESHKNTLRQALEILDKGLDPSKGLPLAGNYVRDIDRSPIRIKKLPKGWVVYSVGIDLKDDGGIDLPTSRPDFVVHLSMATYVPVPKAPVVPTLKGPRGGPAAPGIPGAPPPSSSTAVK